MKGIRISNLKYKRNIMTNSQYKGIIETIFLYKKNIFFMLVILNSRFCSFLVRTLIKKIIQMTKLLKQIFYNKNKEKKDRKDKAWINLQALIWDKVSGKQSSLNLSSFCGFIEFLVEFQLSFNFCWVFC